MEGVTLAGLRQQHDRGPDPGDTAIPPHCPSYCFLTEKLSPIAYSLVNWLHSWENPKSLCYSHFLTGAPQNTPFGILKNICEIILYRYSAYRGSSFFFYLQFICKFNDVWSFAYLIIFYKLIIYVGIWTLFKVAIESYIKCFMGCLKVNIENFESKHLLIVFSSKSWTSSLGYLSEYS